MQDTLTKLFNQLYFPMGGYEAETETMWMSEGRWVKLVAIKTNNGIICVTGNGETIKVDTLEELEQVFLSYFKGKGLQGIIGIKK